MTRRPSPAPSCAECMTARGRSLQRHGVKLEGWDHVVALAGNPNTGKSTIFNNLTGLRQHTGNWPGKTVTRAEGGFSFHGRRYKVVDLPGTYSLLSASPDEEVARDFLLFGRPDVTLVVVDATRLQRNLNLVLQVLQITERAAVALNLTDEAEAHGLTIDERGLARDLGVPVVPMAARQGRGMSALIDTVAALATGEIETRPHRPEADIPGLGDALRSLTARVRRLFPGLPNAEWIALRLLEGDERIAEAVRSGELAALASPTRSPGERR